MVRRRASEPADLLTTPKVAELLGVSAQTLRRRDDSGKFRGRRHPMNSYRMYARDEVVELRKKIVDGGWAA